MNSSSLSAPYTPVPIDVLERQASECEAKAADPTLAVHEAENLLRQAKQFRAAIALEREHRAGCEPYPLADIIREHELWAYEATCKALLIGAAVMLLAVMVLGGGQ